MSRKADAFRGSRGQATVELALVMVVLMVLLAGTVDFARALNGVTRMTSAAFNGARYGMGHPADTSGIVTRVQNGLTGSPLTNVQVTVSYPAGAVPGNPIRVNVQGQLPTLVGAVFGRSSLDIQRFVEMIIL